MIGPPLVDSARAPGAPPGRPGSARRGERGGVSWVSLLLFILVAGGGYLAWIWGPVYLLNYEVKQTVRDYMNQAIKNPDDEALRRNLVLKLRSLAQRDAVDEWGRRVRLPVVQVEERDVTWDRDPQSQPPMLRVSFEYAHDIEYPGLKRTATKVFFVDLSNDLTIPDWGPPR